jgi:arsenate reductase-like glutaredoxin family protein
MITDKDIKKLVAEFSKVFVTKEEFLINKFDVSSEFAKTREEMVTKAELVSFKSETLTRFDALMKELKGIREDYFGHEGRHQDTEEEIGSLRERVATLEHPVVITHRIKK